MKLFLTALLGITAAGLAAGDAHAQSVATIAQTGTRHVAEVDQRGAGNEAQVVQLTATHYTFLDQSGGSLADIRQQGAPGVGNHDNCILLDQAGGATAQITQTGAHNTVWGTGSRIGTPMVLDMARSDASTLVVDQSGWSNVLYLDQVGSSASVVQTGQFNTSWVTQR